MSRPGTGRCCARPGPAAVCAAVGWQLGTACLTAPGTVVCPLCAATVAGQTVRPGVVEIAAHPPAGAVTCSACGTIHARLACPGCGQAIAAADAVLHGLSFAGETSS